MKRVSEKAKALPIAPGMDRNVHHLFLASQRKTYSALVFGAERLVRWLNGWETLADQIHSWDVDDREYKLYLAKYGGDPKRRVPLFEWTEGSRQNILTILGMMRSVPAEMCRRAGGDPEILAILRDPKTVYGLSDIDRLLERYEIVPKVLFQPATGTYAIGYRTPRSHYASFGQTFEEVEAEEQEMAAWPPDPEPTEQELASRAMLRAQQGPPYAEVQAAHAILDLARFGVLDCIRQCYCETWFYAKRPDNIHCSPRCRHKQYEMSPAFRAKRRNYSRELYQKKRAGVGAFAKAASSKKSATKPR